MSEQKYEFFTARFTENQARYLAERKFLSADLQKLLSNAVLGKEGWLVLPLDVDTAERFCDEFTFELAVRGFRSDDEPNAEGLLLEDLIDQFNPAD